MTTNRITEKGVTAYTEKDDVPPSLFRWLQKLGIVFPRVSTYSITITPSVVNSAVDGTQTQTFTVSGLNTNDIVTVSPNAFQAGLGIGYVRVSASNTLQVRFYNASGGNLTPTAGTWLLTAVRL